MVCARLHIICGNCGCNDMFKYHIDPKGTSICDDEGNEQLRPAVYISCENCSTLHRLDDTNPEKSSSS